MWLFAFAFKPIPCFFASDVDGGAGGEGPAKEASAEGQLAGSEEGGAEEGSGICVKATVGRVKLLLHSEDDPLATITLQGTP